ncbi:sensor histidine kinase [Bombiscardovia coagulans]|uniref:histidine kinase n=1 Tax=Bombiscardovia coagulans TaxID=686666 RepID=A0A261EPJ7_9BIFI|nr:histidine kinase [Bombiscardovia coagulans]OZG48774.1 two-component system sensor histidine kinase [Bombiscardovia coagulans]
MKPKGKLQAWIAVWNRPTTAYVMVFICAMYETMLLTRLTLAPHSANKTLWQILSTTGWGMPSFVAIIILSVAVLSQRRSRPTASLLIVTFFMLLTAIIYGSAYTYLFLLWIVNLYASTVEIKKPTTLLIALLAVGLFGVASAASATLWHKDGSFTGLLYPTSLCFVLCVGFGFVSRTQRERRMSDQALQDERERSMHLAQEHEQAVNQSRIAAELHDSVGHDLTAIIALSEGLDRATGRPEIDEAIAMINDLSRQGLTDTRMAVKALQSTTNSAIQHSVSEGQYHYWDDINPILSHVRRLGITVALTETGRRPQDPIQADLSFSVTREGITNAIRHGQAVDRIVISWDHDDKGAITIAIRNNGLNSMKKTLDDGTGLKRLGGTIRKHGGTFEAGPTYNGWILRVTIPSLTKLTDSKEQHDSRYDR